MGTEGGGIGWGWVGYLAASVGIRSVTSGPSGKGWGIRGAGVTRGRSTTLQVTGIFIALVWTATTQQPDPAREISRFPLTHKHAHTHAHAHAHALARKNAHTHTRMQIHTRKTQTNTHTHTPTYTYAHTQTFTNTHTHTHILLSLRLHLQALF